MDKFSNDATTTCSKHNKIFEKAGFGAATGNPKPCKFHLQQSKVENYALGLKPSGRESFNDAIGCPKYNNNNNNFEKAGFGAAMGNPKPFKFLLQKSNLQKHALGFKPSGGEFFFPVMQRLRALLR